MENYIIDELKRHKDFKDNVFIKELQVDYRSNEDETITEFLTLPISLSNRDHNPELERRIDAYRAAFDSIYKMKVPSEIGIGD